MFSESVLCVLLLSVKRQSLPGEMQNSGLKLPHLRGYFATRRHRLTLPSRATLFVSLQNASCIYHLSHTCEKLSQPPQLTPFTSSRFGTPFSPTLCWRGPSAKCASDVMQTLIAHCVKKKIHCSYSVSSGGAYVNLGHNGFGEFQ